MTEHYTVNRRILLTTAVFMFTLILICGGMGVYILSDPGLRDSMYMARVAVEVRDTYPEALDWERMFDAAMEAMSDKLDRYSGYLRSDQLEQFDEELTGTYGGIGVTVIRHDRGLMVMSVREIGPAAEAGILSGDIIIEADSTKLRWLSVEEASKALRGEPGSELSLTVFRPVSNDTITVKLKRAQIDLLHTPFAGYTPDSILYIRLLDFDAGAAQDVAAALDSLLADNGIPKGVILDLRGNPGGLFSEAYQTADLFLEGGQFIVGTSARSRWNERDYYSTGDDVTGGAPMAILVDRGSASAAEIVGGALSQLDRAILVGDTTFGKGLVQGFTRFWDGSGMRLTISRYYLEGDVYLNEFDSTLEDIGHGLPPDHYFKSQERYEFPRDLERSLLLQEFANQHQDEIVSSSGEFRLSGEWADRFERHCRSQGFQFTSGATQAALLMNEVATLDRARIPLVKKVGQVLRRARSEDRRQFERYSDYIKMRLKQIAYERKYGIYEAYARVLVRERPEIQFATQLLLDKPS